MKKLASSAGQTMPPASLGVLHEMIYCANFLMPRSTPRAELVGLLRKSHKTRRPSARGTARKGRPPSMTSISLRPRA